MHFMELVLLEIFWEKIRISVTATHCHGLAAYTIRRGIRFKRRNMLRHARSKHKKMTPSLALSDV